MQVELKANQKEYRSLVNEYWCYLLFTIKVKYNKKKEVNQIKRIASLKAASNYNINKSIRVLNKKRGSNGVITDHKQQGGNMPNHNSAQRYLILFRKAVISEQKYMSHNSGDYLAKCSYHNLIKGELGGPTGSRAEAVKQYKRSNNKWKK